MKLFKKSLCALMVLALLIPFAAAVGTESSAEKVTLIVQLEDGSSVEQVNSARRAGQTVSEADVTKSILKAQSRVQRNVLFKVDADVRFGYNYTAALNGFSMEADPADVDAVRALDNVKNVYISQSHIITDNVRHKNAENLHTDYGALMTCIDKLHDEGYRGEGTVIAIVDTEFDTNHEFLTGEVDNPRLSKSDIADAVADLELNADTTVDQVWKSDKIPFAYNYFDLNGDTYSSDSDIIHGTHVAGIAAGKNGRFLDGTEFDGCAPEAQLLCMAVRTLDDYLCIAAIDDAIKLGADVLNTSWGSDYVETDLYDYVFKNAALSGMFVANSAGNSAMGADMTNPPAAFFDYGSLGDPGNCGSATLVSSAESNAIWMYKLRVYVDGTPFENAVNQNWFAYFEDSVDSENGLEHVICGTDYDYGGDLTDKIGVFEIGGEGYSDARILNTARSCGARAVIVAVPDEQFWDYQMDSEVLGQMPVAAVPYSERGLLNGGKRITADFLPTVDIYRDRVVMSYFSAWGVYSNLNLDPNITAVGGSVWSSLPDGRYDSMGGTSMASPQVAGAAAVLREYLTKNEPSFQRSSPAEKSIEIENRMMSTAVTIYNGYPEEEPATPASPRLQGAGLLDAYAAAKTPVTLAGEDGRTRVQLRDKLTNDISFCFTASNHSDRDVTYSEVTLDVFTNAVSYGTVMEYGQFIKTVNVSLPRSVTVPAGGKTTVTVKFTLDGDNVAELEKDYVNGFYIDGFVHLVSDTDDPSLVIPFMGFHGDWNGGPLLDHTGYVDGGFKLGSGRFCHEYTIDIYNHRRDGCRTLGVNRILEDHAGELPDVIDYDARYTDKDYGGISPNSDGSFDFLCMSFIPLRNVDSAIYKIMDGDGNVLLSHEATVEDEGLMTRYLSRCHEFNCGELTGAGVSVEGDYKASVTLRRIGTADSDTMDLPFYVDCTKPRVTRLKVENNTLSAAMTDNRHLMGIELFDADTGEWLTGVPFAGGGDRTVSIDISEWSDKTVMVKVSDYAGNYVEMLTDELKGDINGDGEISNADLVLLARYAVKLVEFTTKQWIRADFKPDGEVDNQDVVALARYLVNA